MRSTLLMAAAVAAFTLVSSAGLPNAEERSLEAFLTGENFCGPEEMQARRNALGQLLAGAQAYAQTQPATADTPPPLMAGLGDAHMQISTSNAQAQAYFDQGLRMLHGFNHGEAARAFRHAQRLDPSCAMCFWGEAFALGPNINAPMNRNDNDAAYRAARAASDKAQNVSAVERELIEAMSTRYTRRWPASRAPLDAGFAEAMADVAAQFPDNDLVQILSAEADMDTQPWDYWQAGGKEPKGRAGHAIERIETVLARSPNNAGAIHLYIHLAEASTNPWRAQRAAERLATVAPQAGHLVHMPGHIYYRIGRFRDSIRQNVIASAVDEAYIRSANASAMYQYGYYPHNLHFVVTSAQQGGDGRLALDYSERLDRAVPMEMAAQIGLAQTVKAAPWFARAQFAPPSTIIGANAPPQNVAYITGAWRYARGIAYVRLNQLAEARREADAMQALMQSGDFRVLNDGGVPAQDIIRVLRHIVLGKAFMAERKYDDAVRELQMAVELQGRVPYTEPPYVYYPVRRTLGAAYLMAGQPELAEQQFLQTLIEHPNDAYAYWGLAEAKRGQRDTRGAQAARSLFNAAFIGPRSGLTPMSL